MSSKNEFEGLTPHSQSVFGINQLNVKKYHDFNLMIGKELKGYYYFIQSGSNAVPYNSLSNSPDHSYAHNYTL